MPLIVIKAYLSVNLLPDLSLNDIDCAFVLWSALLNQDNFLGIDSVFNCL